MKGDFSRWQFHPRDNFNGILPQQGKLLIDADGLAQTRIANHWQQVAARDWVGPVAGVPASEPNSFEITQASLNADGTVTLKVGAGRIWADGMLVQLGDAGTVLRTATWLEPPVVPNQGGASTVAAGVEDAVVLEVWQEGINGYQMPNALIEPALGGPDTAERMHTGVAFRLARLTAGQTCKTITDGNDAGLGKLTASLQPTTVIAGDCPVPVGGGYSGFEHRLYRIEIADVNAGSPNKFKWSRQNGGLVGRGTFQPASNSLTITANMVAITTANQPSFYVEIEQWDDTRGNWQVLCGATAMLNNETLQFPAAPAFGAYPAALGPVFFRLWDGIDQVSNFPVEANPNELEDGIFLQFDPDGAGVYRPRDYWVFAVRAGGIANPQTLIDHGPPEGIRYHRVPLAEITWDAAGKSSAIENCRVTVQPLGTTRGCCTCEVGDGVTSSGQFTSIQEAIDSLPAEGGEVCILAGRYFEQVQISDRTNVTIHGCGPETRIASPSFQPKPPAGSAGPVIAIQNSQGIVLRDFVVEADDGDIGIELIGRSTNTIPAALARARGVTRGITDVTMRDLIVIASTRAAVSGETVREVKLEDCTIAMKDVISDFAAVYFAGQEIHVVNNWVGLYTSAVMPAIVQADLGSTAASGSSSAAAKTPGGIQIGGISRDVYVQRNEIESGSGNGITLGSVILIDGKGNQVNGNVGYNPTGQPQDPCNDGNFLIPGSFVYGTGKETVSAVVEGRLTNLHLENNRIRNMGLCGIGPIGFFNLRDNQEVVTVNGLWIVANEIAYCLRRNLNRFKSTESSTLGYGGICLPDVAEVVVRDNLILDTGAALADPVCGIFVLHGEQVEISRNQILDLRDWSATDVETISGFRGGISIVMVTPLDATAPAASAFLKATKANARIPRSLYLQGDPALIIQENVINIPAGLALGVAGLGAFSICGNQFATGGAFDEVFTLARGVMVLNFGSPLELPIPVSTTAQILALFEAVNEGANSAQALETLAGSISSIVGTVAPGPVIFSQNRCSVEQSFTSRTALTSVFIATFDDLGFHDNQCWLDTPERQVECDAFLLGASVRVTGCRFQEKPKIVSFSAITFGLMNITSLNETTNALWSFGPPAQSMTTGNVVA